MKKIDRKFSVAPMMEWTDRHCRFFHRQLSKKAVLFTEMVTADAVIFGDQDKLLGFDICENPLVVQLGGSDPQKLHDAAQICQSYGYDEINLNVGCPSDRVQSGRFGACLMQEPELVARCVSAMKNAVDLPITVKCRIGVDDQDPEIALFKIANMVRDAGCDSLTVHARKAWLKGLSPKENRDIPPLDYDIVYRLKQEMPDFEILINGGIATAAEGIQHLKHVDGVMLGRAAYHHPYELCSVDELYYGDGVNELDEIDMLKTMHTYIDQYISLGNRAHGITRHMLGFFHGAPRARKWRRLLTEQAVRETCTADILWDAYQEIVDGRLNKLETSEVA